VANKEKDQVIADITLGFLCEEYSATL